MPPIAKTSLLLLLFGWMLSLAAGVASAQEDESAAVFPIGFVALENDPRQSAARVYYEIPVAPLGPAMPGAEVAIIDSEVIGHEIGVTFTLETTQSDDIGALAETVAGWVDQGVTFVVADLPAEQLLALADAVADLPVTLFNTSASEDVLRGEACRINVIHTIPSRRMLTDSAAQFLADRRWEEVLMLRGPTEDDHEIADAFLESSRIAGLNIVEIRDFTVTANPRTPYASPVALLTAGIDYDVVFIADAAGEFAATVPGRTREARPVIGTAGLVPLAWHWAWERAGAPQLNARFEYQAGRRMGEADWAAWVSVRAIVQAVVRTGSGEPGEDGVPDHAALLDYILSDNLNLDGAKGTPLTVRPWDHQLRQPLMIATHNNVVERAPLEGFVHPTNDLDTLGVGEARTECQFE